MLKPFICTTFIDQKPINLKKREKIMDFAILKLPTNESQMLVHYHPANLLPKKALPVFFSKKLVLVIPLMLQETFYSMRLTLSKNRHTGVIRKKKNNLSENSTCLFVVITKSEITATLHHLCLYCTLPI